MRLTKGLSFSPRRALGITGARLRLSHKLGFPTTRYGVQRRVGQQVLGGGCLLWVIAAIVLAAAVWGCL